MRVLFASLLMLGACEKPAPAVEPVPLPPVHVEATHARDVVPTAEGVATLEAGAASPLLSPMATAIAWGLTFATVLTLIVVPCFYRIVDDVGGGLARAFGPALRWVTDPGDVADEDPRAAE